jgi:muconolactone delta-isomerase
MPEYLVTMDIVIEGLPLEARRKLLKAEAAACRPYMLAGKFVRAWRSWGLHEYNHGHVALWNAGSRAEVLAAYRTFPLVNQHYAVRLEITVLHKNPNDPGPDKGNLIPSVPFALTYDNLREWLDDHGTPGHSMGEGMIAEIGPGIAIHDHPQSGRPREIHFMVDGQKIAEIGPPDGNAGEVAPGYINFLAEWMGKPVHHEEWKQRILQDNGLLHPSYEAAVAAGRVTRVTPVPGRS